MKSQLKKSGIELLSTLGKHAELIMESFLKKGVPDDCDIKALEKLRAQGLIYQADNDEGLHLSKAIREFLEKTLKDERNRQIDSSLGDSLILIKHTIANYKEAKAKHYYDTSENYLKEIAELVFNIIEALHHNLNVLATRIDNEFALVGTLTAKIRENELAHTQVERVLGCLELFDFEELAQLAGNDKVLRRLLIVNLQHELEYCHAELKAVQARLLTLLGKFRNFALQAKLIRGFDLYTETHPDFLPSHYTELANCPLLFNHIQAIKINASADITVAQHESFFVDLIQSLNIKKDSSTAINNREAIAVSVEEIAEEVLMIPLEIQALESFFCAVIDNQGKPLSACDYYQQIDFNWELEFWLFSVLSYLGSMNKSTKAYFKHRLIIQSHDSFSGNVIIEDVQLWKR